MATKKQHEAFNKKIEKLVFSLGGIVGAKSYKYSIETNAGILNITTHDPEKSDIFSVYCCFDSPTTAVEVFNTELLSISGDGRLNVCSGKWNFHSKDEYSLFHEFKNKLTKLTTLNQGADYWFNAECEKALAEVPQGIKDMAKKSRSMTLQIAETIALKKCFRKEAVLTFLDSRTFLCKN